MEGGGGREQEENLSSRDEPKPKTNKRQRSSINASSSCNDDEIRNVHQPSGESTTENNTPAACRSQSNRVVAAGPKLKCSNSSSDFIEILDVDGVDILDVYTLAAKKQQNTESVVASEKTRLAKNSSTSSSPNKSNRRFITDFFQRSPPSSDSKRQPPNRKPQQRCDGDNNKNNRNTENDIVRVWSNKGGTAVDENPTFQANKEKMKAAKDKNSIKLKKPPGWDSDSEIEVWDTKEEKHVEKSSKLLEKSTSSSTAAKIQLKKPPGCDIVIEVWDTKEEKHVEKASKLLEKSTSSSTAAKIQLKKPPGCDSDIEVWDKNEEVKHLNKSSELPGRSASSSTAPKTQLKKPPERSPGEHDTEIIASWNNADEIVIEEKSTIIPKRSATAALSSAKHPQPYSKNRQHQPYNHLKKSPESPPPPSRHKDSSCGSLEEDSKMPYNPKLSSRNKNNHGSMNVTSSSGEMLPSNIHLQQPEASLVLAGAAASTVQLPQEQKQNGLADEEDWVGYLRRNLPKSDLPPLFSLEEFKNMILLAEEDFDFYVEDIERGKLIKGKMKNDDTTEQISAQHGRLLPDTVNKLLVSVLNVQPIDVFVDFGHGTGLLLLQASYTIGCESRGVEIDSNRQFVAECFQKSFEEQLHKHHHLRDNRETAVGRIILKHGELQAPDFREFLTNVNLSPSIESASINSKPSTGVIKALCNNYNQAFGEKAVKGKNLYSPDNFLAGLFTLMKAGSVLVTLEKLDLGLSRSEANKIRKKHNLPQSDRASFFEMEEHVLGLSKELSTWGTLDGEVKAYKCTRLLQEGADQAVFMCCYETCGKQYDATKIIEQGGSKKNVINTKCTHCGRVPQGLWHRQDRNGG